MSLKKTSKKILLAFLALGLMIIAIPTVSQANPSDYGGSYKPNIGDKGVYKVTKLDFPGSNPYMDYPFTLENGSLVNYSVTLNVLTTITVVDKNSSSGHEYIYTQQTVNTSENKILTSPVTKGSTYISYGFNDFDSAKSYYTKAYSLFKNSTSTNYTYHLEGDLTYFAINSSSGGYQIYSLTVRNWKTGWTTSLYYLQKDSTGSLVVEKQEDLIRYVPITKNAPGFTFTIFFGAFVILLSIDQKRKK